MFKRWMAIDTQKSALILGPRRAGKTTLVKTLFPDWSYVTLDNLDHLDWAGRDPKGFYMKHHVLTGQNPPATCFQMPFFDNILYYLG